MSSDEGLSQASTEAIIDEKEKLNEVVEEDDDEDDEDDDDEETWDEMHAECESFLSCLFCVENFKTMAVALEHCKTDHNFSFTELKNKFNMDCYSYICMINYVRKEGITPDVLISFNEPIWLTPENLTPVIEDDPWLMLDFEGLESPSDDGSSSPEQNYHVVNSENGLVTLTEQHFAQLRHKLRHLSLQVEEKEEALFLAAAKMEKMKKVTQNLLSEGCNELLDGKDFEKQIYKLKLRQDDAYFNQYSYVGIHLQMLSDKVRTSSYRDAIMNNSCLIANKLVLDVGCGTGILSMFAAAAGASKVFGVDQSDMIYSAMDIVRDNNLSDKIDLFHGRIEDITLPVEKVDIIVSEWMGYFLLYEGMLDSLVIARNRFLKPDGLLFPNKCILYLVGVSNADMHKKLVEFWSDVYGFKMNCLVNEVTKEAHIFRIIDKTVVTSSSPILTLDLYKVSSSSTNFTSDFSLESEIDGHLHALCGYFDAVFDFPSPTILTTSPKGEKTHWKHTVFLLKNPIPVSTGCIVKGTIMCEKFEEDPRALRITISVHGQTNVYYLT